MKKVFCECGAELMVVERCGNAFIMACMYCDMPYEEVKVYNNTCWNCGYGIDSRFSQPSAIPGMGYHCGRCGKDLTEWKLRHGLITATQLYELTGGQLCCSTAITVQRSTVTM